MRVDLARGLDLEVEGNDTQAAASVLTYATGSGSFQSRVAGTLTTGDSAGDYFRLGTLNVGNAIDLSVALPSFGGLQAGDVILSIERAGGGTPVAVGANGSLHHTVSTDGVYYVRVRSDARRGLRAQYLLGVSVTDGVSPAITSTTLAAEGGTTTAVIDRFTLNFSEDMAIAAVNDPAHLDLRAAGPDGAFGTSDDRVYALASSGYAGGLSASYRITDGPLQPGTYRLAPGPATPTGRATRSRRRTR